jgi:hypothetical protein
LMIYMKKTDTNTKTLNQQRLKNTYSEAKLE